VLAVDRNQTEAGTSYLSPYFRFGLLSPRQVYWAAQKARTEIASPSRQNSIEAWVSELIWREFYMHILHFFPHVMGSSFRPKYDQLAWRYAEGELQAWQAGMTGYPVVDAAMRQLKTIGWMHNRARMIVASFLTKHLLMDWREGERHFMRWLIDGDPAANNGGWQWVAGTGTDAQPYFRIFNPISQSQKFDPAGIYIRRWIPELRDVPTQYIHAPHQMPTTPRHYPPPIVDHAFARARALAAYQAIK
jgi:deoxyribodipyrimidine photo-lyase